jgi:2,3-bisphosphoglycerate-independent phosphoglycerate mutase
VRNHSGDPVPVTLVDENVRRDRIDSFDEFSAPSGGLCRIRGLDLMPIIMDLIGVAEKYGA